MFYIGLDLGQKQDHTAIAVVERREADELQLRHIERVALGTPYPKVVERVRWITEHADLAGQCALAVDATGVGTPVVDMLWAAGLGCEISAVTITGGERERHAGSQRDAAWSVPKRDLIARVQVLIEQGELKIARGMRGAGPLVKELANVRMTARESGRIRLGADGAGEHDDLVIALALACWRAGRKAEMRIGFRGRRLTGI
jgi:hypothetical protein